MTAKEIRRRFGELFRISAPVMAEQSFVMMMGFVSSVLVASIGEHAVSAVAMVDSVSQLIIAFYAALTTGGTIVVAQYMGRKDADKAKSAAGQAFILSALLSLVILIFFAAFGGNVIDTVFADAEPDVKESAYRFLFIIMFSYPFLAAVQTSFGILRGSGDTRTPMFISIIMNIVNLSLGLVLIRGLNLPFVTIPSFGVGGAAAALLTGRVVGFVICCRVLTAGKSTLRLNKWKIFKPNFGAARNILKLGIPTSVESTLFQLGKLITMMFVVSMSTSAIAANAIGGTLLGIINVAGSGFSLGVMVLCGQKIGRGETDDIIKTTVFAVIINIVFMGAVSLVLLVLFNPIVSLYSVEPETYRFLRQLMFSVFIMQILFWPWSFITPAALRAAGDVKYTMTVSVISMWVFRIGLGYIFAIVLKLGVLGVWMGMYSDWIVRGALFIKRLLDGKWRGKGIT
jgi:putative MATE family efflux protein